LSTLFLFFCTRVFLETIFNKKLKNAHRWFLQHKFTLNTCATVSQDSRKHMKDVDPIMLKWKSRWLPSRTEWHYQ